MPTAGWNRNRIHSQWKMTIISKKQFWPLRLRKLNERKKPPAAVPLGVLGSSSSNCENSVPGRSMSRVMLLSTSSVKASGRSWRSFSTKKSGLKMMGSRPSPLPPISDSWLITTLHTVPLRTQISWHHAVFIVYLPIKLFKKTLNMSFKDTMIYNENFSFSE